MYWGLFISKEERNDIGWTKIPENTTKNIWNKSTKNIQKINVWAGKCGDQVIELFSIPGNVNAETDLELLQDPIDPVITNAAENINY